MSLKLAVLVLLVAVSYSKADKVDCFDQAKLDEKTEKLKEFVEACKSVKEESDEKYKECIEGKWNEKMGGGLDVKKVIKIKLDMAIAKYSDIAIAALDCQSQVDESTIYPHITFQTCLHEKFKDMCNLSDHGKVKDEMFGTGSS